MDTEPQVKVLPYKRRKSLFNLLLLIFLITFPVFVFYTSGYRLSFENEETTIVTTGGIYVTTDDLEVDVYLDEEKVDRPRLFRSAYYIQTVENGLHRVVVQQPGLHTWVKVLPVDSYIVTEAAAFNMPVLPVIRPITEFLNQAGQGVVVVKGSTSTPLSAKATTTGNFVVVNKVAQASLRVNSEYTYVDALFASSSATTTSLFTLIEDEIDKFTSTTTASTTKKVEEEYIEQGNMRLVKRSGELFAWWAGSGASTPHYFCTSQQATSTVALRLGKHVAEQMDQQRLSTTTPLHVEGSRICRTTIRLDRKWQDLSYYEFFPRSSDLVVMQLQDGLYVTEIDDRGWQNTQMVYPGDSFEVFVTDTNIYIKEDGNYFELVTRIEQQN